MSEFVMFVAASILALPFAAYDAVRAPAKARHS